MSTSRRDRFKAWWAHAFAVDDPERGVGSEEEALAERAARFLVRRRLTVPSLMVLEMSRPLNFICSQFLTFLSPFATLVFSPPEYERFVRFLEKRQSVEVMINKVTECENQRDG